MCPHSQLPLPAQPLSGMLNKFGAKVRLQFKMEIDQLWIGTKGESSLFVGLFVIMFTSLLGTSWYWIFRKVCCDVPLSILGAISNFRSIIIIIIPNKGLEAQRVHPLISCTIIILCFRVVGMTFKYVDCIVVIPEVMQLNIHALTHAHPCIAWM